MMKYDEEDLFTFLMIFTHGREYGMDKDKD
jgi:hypothetical protein